jgi:hypothetical protein
MGCGKASNISEQGNSTTIEPRITYIILGLLKGLFGLHLNGSTIMKKQD